MKSISERELLVHRPITKLESINFDKDKNPERLMKKKKRPMQEVDASRRSTLGIRVFLKDMCIGFLSNVYNFIMRNVKSQLAHQNSESSDESFYMCAIKFFMEFNRHNGCEIDIVSETFSVKTLHYIQTQLDVYTENLTLDKENPLKWSKRCHVALRAYKELIMTVLELEKSKDTIVRESCNVIKSNMFYVVEYRELPLQLLQCYDEVKFPLSYLKDLVEMVHIFLKMLEHQSAKCRLLLVEKKKRKVRKSKKKKKAEVEKKAEMSETQLEEVWSEIAESVSSAIKGDDPLPSIMPFDPASDTSIDDQRNDAMKRIHHFLHDKQVPEALALLRASREVWPENDLFGSPNITPEDEFLAVREIFFTRIEVPAPDNAAAFNDDNENNNSDEDMQDDDEDEERQMELSKVEEEFKFSVFIKRFSTWKVVRAYGILLRDFQTNSSFINHCIVKMLHRIAWDCAIPAMLFQASIFRTFQRLLNYPGAEESTKTKEMVKFARFVLSKFFQVARNSDKVFAELLFWKSARDAIEVVEGYGSTNQQTKRGTQHVWTEEEEDELKKLFERYKDDENIDLLDSIMEHLSGSRTRQQIVRQLISQGLLSKEQTKKLRKSSSSAAKQKTAWSAEEIEQVVALYNEYKEATDVMGRILDNLTVKRPKKHVIEKLLELGTVTDRKQLRKKRAKKEGTAKKKSKTGKKSGGRFGGDSSEDHEDDLSDDKDESCNETSGESSADETRKPAKIKKGAKNYKYSAIELKAALLKAVQEGHSENVSWIRNELLGIAADRDGEDALDATPIVPLTEAAQRAFDNKTFKRLLKFLGLREPASEQESFWRCPETLLPAQLREMSCILTGALSGDLDMAVEQVGSSTEMENNDGMKEERKSNKKSSRSKRANAVNLESDESSVKSSSSKEKSDSESDLDNEISDKSKRKVDFKKSSSRSRIIRIDSDSDDNDSTAKPLPGTSFSLEEDTDLVVDLNLEKDKSDIDVVPEGNSSNLLEEENEGNPSGDMDVDDNIPVVRKVGKKRVLMLSDDDADEDISYPVRNDLDSLQDQDSSNSTVDKDVPINSRDDRRKKRIRMLESDSD